METAILLGGLIRVGYTSHELHDLLHWRLDMLYDVTKQNIYDIYASEADSQRVPRPYRRLPLVKPEFYEPYGLRLPYIHDLFALSRADSLLRSDDMEKVDHVISYILDDRYRALSQGYGCQIRMVRGKPRCNAIGWSAHLPALDGLDAGANHPALVLWVELMSHFPLARQHPWFDAALKHLDTFRTRRNTWRFPAGYLIERKGYYTLGAHMRFDSGTSIEVNSTLRMLCIQQRTNRLTKKVPRRRQWNAPDSARHFLPANDGDCL